MAEYSSQFNPCDCSSFDEAACYVWLRTVSNDTLCHQNIAFAPAKEPSLRKDELK